MTYVLRVKGETTGHVFYDYVETDNLTSSNYLACEKLKYATEFKSKAEAELFKDNYCNGDDFEVVSLAQAEEEYRK